MIDKMNEQLKNFGLWFSKIREDSGFKSQRQLSIFSGVSNTTISRMESGEQKASPQTLGKLAPHLNCSFEDLMIKAGYLPCNMDTPLNAVEVASTYAVPVLGHIPAGAPCIARESIEYYEDLPSKWLNSEPHNFFILRVEGDSMEGARIFDGDLALIKKQRTFDHGQICAVGISGNTPDLYATLKYVYVIDDEFVELVPANNKYPRKKVPVKFVNIFGILKKTFRNH
ncbi:MULTISPECIES: LexA family protein [Pelosinus]|jgi:repressor LexA|uniref:Peptidase S24/S26A/S26B, conserved region n=1 Tax=Pelosinus fermentans B4 TaxID=1149862 RepID=I9LJG2_9FIRM|nr:MULTISPECIES: S24 family peptidase [Pelosinus]EIW20561.1 Peptidase S24/S26A/S26B, conserved region [Pelosinus fermentans B4]EIW25724.1 phage repressor like transcriptional regulator, XRE family [Pelosinus fermentans A11]OAM93448.1 phage repressor like transcriptional regulator, XRE family [Pelosinus fermentans DSM 17108]SDQ78177.1 repressor LexA [Pelosinus fermentans]